MKDDNYSSRFTRTGFNEVDMTRILYHALKQGEIKIDDETLNSDVEPIAFYMPEFHDADIGRLFIKLETPENPIAIITHQLIEVKYNDQALSNIIDQITRREARYRAYGLDDTIKNLSEIAERDGRLDEQKELKQMGFKVEHRIESLLFHNTPTEGLIKACKKANIRLFQYAIRVTTHLDERSED